jgi:hypothetical protein
VRSAASRLCLSLVLVNLLVNDGRLSAFAVCMHCHLSEHVCSCCCCPVQARQAELEGLQASLTADADALSQQLSTFEARREDAVRELQVQSQYLAQAAGHARDRVGVSAHMLLTSQGGHSCDQLDVSGLRG